MADAVGRVEVEISANTAQFEQALARARQLASGLSNIQIGGGSQGTAAGSAALRAFTGHAGAAQQAAAALVAQNHALALAFRTVAGALSVLQGPLGPIAGRFGFLGTLIGRVGVGMAGFGVAVAGVVISVNEAIDAFAEEEKQLLTLNAVLKATQGASGQTADSLADMADSLSKTTLATDDSVRSAQALLLTFRKISSDEFPRALAAAQDLAATGFGSIEGNARQLGRALEDPIRGLGALRRSGVTFSATQREVIKSLVETGRVAEAQREVLKAIEIQVGGAGATQASGVTGAYHRLSEAVNNVTVVMGSWFSRVLHIPQMADAAANGLNALIDKGDKLSYTIAGVTKEFERFETAQEKSARLAREAEEAKNREIKQAKELADALKEEMKVRIALEYRGRFTDTMSTEDDPAKIRAAREAHDAWQKTMQRVHTVIYDLIQRYKEAVSATDVLTERTKEAKDNFDSARIAIEKETRELLENNLQKEIRNRLEKDQIPATSEAGKAIARMTEHLEDLKSALQAAGQAGANMDKLSAQVQAADQAMQAHGFGSFDPNRFVQRAIIEQQKIQKEADAASRSAKNAAEQENAARLQAAATWVKGEGDIQRAQRITIAGEKAKLDAIYQTTEADKTRQLQQQQNLESARLDLQLVGKSIGEQTRLRQELQLTQELERRRILEHIGYTQKDIEAVKALAAEYGKLAQDTAAANLKLSTDFATQSMFLSQTEQKVASAMQQMFPGEWQAHMQDTIAQQIRYNAVLQDTYAATRDFAGTFVHGMLEGKSAIESVTDALKNLENKLIDMALDAVIQGLFSMLLGGGTPGGNIFSNIASFASGGGGGTTKQPLAFAQGGVVGNRAVPTHKGGKLEYDEYPAILHVGERVIPAGGPKPNISGRKMVEMFGGVPKFESGFNAAAAAAGAYTAGDTGATGQWSTVSGGGGNAQLSAWQASQYTTASSQASSGPGPGSGSGPGRVSGGPVVGGPVVGGPVVGGIRGRGFLNAGMGVGMNVRASLAGGPYGPFPQTLAQAMEAAAAAERAGLRVYRGEGYENLGVSGSVGSGVGISNIGLSAGITSKRVKTISVPSHSMGGYIGSTPGLSRWVDSSIFVGAPKFEFGTSETRGYTSSSINTSYSTTPSSSSGTSSQPTSSSYNAATYGGGGGGGGTSLGYGQSSGGGYTATLGSGQSTGGSIAYNAATYGGGGGSFTASPGSGTSALSSPPFSFATQAAASPTAYRGAFSLGGFGSAFSAVVGGSTAALASELPGAMGGDALGLLTPLPTVRLGTPNLRVGADNDPVEVTRVQTFLADHGFPVGPIDGVFGGQTRFALIQFEKTMQALTGERTRISGVVGPQDELRMRRVEEGSAFGVPGGPPPAVTYPAPGPRPYVPGTESYTPFVPIPRDYGVGTDVLGTTGRTGAAVRYTGPTGQMGYPGVGRPFAYGPGIPTGTTVPFPGSFAGTPAPFIPSGPFNVGRGIMPGAGAIPSGFTSPSVFPDLGSGPFVGGHGIYTGVGGGIPTPLYSGTEAARIGTPRSYTPFSTTMPTPHTLPTRQGTLTPADVANIVGPDAIITQFGRGGDRARIVGPDVGNIVTGTRTAPLIRGDTIAAIIGGITPANIERGAPRAHSPALTLRHPVTGDALTSGAPDQAAVIAPDVVGGEVVIPMTVPVRGSGFAPGIPPYPLTVDSGARPGPAPPLTQQIDEAGKKLMEDLGLAPIFRSIFGTDTPGPQGSLTRGPQLAGMFGPVTPPRALENLLYPRGPQGHPALPPEDIPQGRDKLYPGTPGIPPDTQHISIRDAIQLAMNDNYPKAGAYGFRFFPSIGASAGSYEGQKMWYGTEGGKEPAPSPGNQNNRIYIVPLPPPGDLSSLGGGLSPAGRVQLASMVLGGAVPRGDQFAPPLPDIPEGTGQKWWNTPTGRYLFTPPEIYQRDEWDTKNPPLNDELRPGYYLHTGGVVGSTPVPYTWLPTKLFTNAPRFAQGLSGNEYPAVLHRGERVVPAGAGGGGGGTNVTVNVVNNAGANVTTSSSESDNGVRLDIIIDEMVSAKMRDGGSKINRTMSSMGARAGPIRR